MLLLRFKVWNYALASFPSFNGFAPIPGRGVGLFLLSMHHLECFSSVAMHGCVASFCYISKPCVWWFGWVPRRWLRLLPFFNAWVSASSFQSPACDGFAVFQGSGWGLCLIGMHGFECVCSIPMHGCNLPLHFQAWMDGFAPFQGRGVGHFLTSMHGVLMHLLVYNMQHRSWTQREMVGRLKSVKRSWQQRETFFIHLFMTKTLNLLLNIINIMLSFMHIVML